MNQKLIDKAREGRLNALHSFRRTRSRAATPSDVEITNIFGCTDFESFADLSNVVAFQTRGSSAHVATNSTHRRH